MTTIDLIRQWAEDRNLIEGSDPKSQLLKTMSELGELADGINKGRQAEPVVDLFGRPIMVETPTGDIAAAYKFKEMAVLKGLELLGKHLGLFIDKHELTGKNGQPLGQTSGVLLVPGTLKKSEWEKAAKAQAGAEK